MKIPGYQLIFNDLEYKIRKRELLPGSSLPSEHELCRAYAVSRTTVRKAMDMLEEENLIHRRAGVGSFVADFSRRAEEGAKPREIHLGAEFGAGWVHTAYYGPILSGIQGAAGLLGCRITLLPRDELLKAADDFDGRIFYSVEPEIPDQMTQLRRPGSPVILLNRIVDEPGIGYIGVDYRETARRVVERLLRNGARDVALVGGSDDLYRYAPHTRALGWQDAYRAVRGGFPAELYFDYLEPYENFDAFCQVFEQRAFDAVFVAGGNYLPVTIAALSRTGVSVPEEMSIVCFDNMEDAFHKLDIPISYIRVPLARMGELAVEHLFRAARDNRRDVCRQLLEPSLVATDCRFLF